MGVDHRAASSSKMSIASTIQSEASSHSDLQHDSRRYTPFFDGRCAYCDDWLDRDSSTLDHLIPLNSPALGLHTWGNLVACCRHCNKEKHFKSWEEFLRAKAGDQLNSHRAPIVALVAHYRYKPELGLHTIAHNLCQDIGEGGMILLRQRFKQAQETIRAITTNPEAQVCLSCFGLLRLVA